MPRSQVRDLLKDQKISNEENRPQTRYPAVIMQQDPVQLDNDWNE